MSKIGRPNIDDAPPWYPYFFNLAPGDNLVEALQYSKEVTMDLIGLIPVEAENYAYAEGKWTISRFLFIWPTKNDIMLIKQFVTPGK